MNQDTSLSDSGKPIKSLAAFQQVSTPRLSEQTLNVNDPLINEI
jgi:hypothetical protein